MPFDPKLQPFEVLAVAIRSEIDAEKFYAKLQKRLKNIILVQKLKFLAFEEGRHRRILEKLFRQRFGERPLDAPEKSPLPPIVISPCESTPVLDLFQAALKAEEDSESFYDEAGKNAEDEGSRRILAYLSRVERSHAAVIRSEIDLLIQYPEYYNVEDFNLGQDLFNIGP